MSAARLGHYLVFFTIFFLLYFLYQNLFFFVHLFDSILLNHSSGFLHFLGESFLSIFQFRLRLFLQFLELGHETGFLLLFLSFFNFDLSQKFLSLLSIRFNSLLAQILLFLKLGISGIEFFVFFLLESFNFAKLLF